MIKLGCQTLSFKDRFAAGEIDLRGFIDWAHEMRLDGIDIHRDALESTDPDYLHEI